MFATAPPPATGTAAPLYLRRVLARDFAGPAAVAGNPEHRAHLREYLSDLVAPHGTALRERMFSGARGHSYGEMAEALLREVLPPGETVDLLVLAFAIPDIRPGRATATYLSHVCPGTPHAFAICDQGAAAGFTGLRLIGEYARGTHLRRAVLLVVEQSALHYEPVAPAPVPAVHSGVALLTGPAGPVQLRETRQHTAVAPAAAWDLVGAGPAGCVPDVLLAGPGLTARDPLAAQRPGVRLARGGRPYTGLWAALADELATEGPTTTTPATDRPTTTTPTTGRPTTDAPATDQPATDRADRPTVARRIRLADYDAQLRYLCVSTLEVRGTTESRGDTRNAAESTWVELGAA